jgi:hypothetical protein
VGWGGAGFEPRTTDITEFALANMTLRWVRMGWALFLRLAGSLASVDLRWVRIDGVLPGTSRVPGKCDPQMDEDGLNIIFDTSRVPGKYDPQMGEDGLDIISETSRVPSKCDPQMGEDCWSYIYQELTGSSTDVALRGERIGWMSYLEKIGLNVNT